MHPIFEHRRGLGLYLLAWTPMAALLTGLLALVGESVWTEAVVIAVPLTVVYAFLCLAAWYPCRALPLGTADTLRALGVHTATGFISAATWVGLAWAFARVLDRSVAFSGVGNRVAGQAALLFAFGFLAYQLSVAVHYLLGAFEDSRNAERRAMHAEVASKVAELEMLRTQVNPHFLFNSLNSVSSLTTRDPEAARTMCIELGNLLRDTLRLATQPTISLAEELSTTRRYLNIETMRFGTRLRVEETVDDGCGDRLVPSMVLQPLVENALKHGISESLDGGVITIAATCTDSRLTLSVSNPIDEAGRPRSRPGLGLSNLRRRLHALYGGLASLTTRTENGRFTAEVRLPSPSAGAETEVTE